MSVAWFLAWFPLLRSFGYDLEDFADLFKIPLGQFSSKNYLPSLASLSIGECSYLPMRTFFVFAVKEEGHSSFGSEEGIYMMEEKH